MERLLTEAPLRDAAHRRNRGSVRADHRPLRLRGARHSRRKLHGSAGRRCRTGAAGWTAQHEAEGHLGLGAHFTWLVAAEYRGSIKVRSGAAFYCRGHIRVRRCAVAAAVFGPTGTANARRPRPRNPRPAAPAGDPDSRFWPNRRETGIPSPEKRGSTPRSPAKSGRVGKFWGFRGLMMRLISPQTPLHART